MGNVKIKPNDVNSIEANDPILIEVRRARMELAEELEKDAEAVHKRALRHVKEFGFKISPLKPTRPKSR